MSELPAIFGVQSSNFNSNSFLLQMFIFRKYVYNSFITNYFSFITISKKPDVKGM